MFHFCSLYSEQLFINFVSICSTDYSSKASMSQSTASVAVAGLSVINKSETTAYILAKFL